MLGYVVVFPRLVAGQARWHHASRKGLREDLPEATLGTTLLNGVLGPDTALWALRTSRLGLQLLREFDEVASDDVEGGVGLLRFSFGAPLQGT